MKIKELREERNIYQKDLAKYLNHSTSCISSWEKAITEPSITDLVKIADFFSVSIDEVVGRTNNVGIVEIKNDLTQAENELVFAYRKLNERDRYKVIGYVYALLN